MPGPGLSLSLALDRATPQPLNRDDAARFVVQAKMGSLGPLERLTPDYLMELKSQLNRWSDEVDVALHQVWRDESKAALCRECGEEHGPDHDCDDA